MDNGAGRTGCGVAPADLPSCLMGLGIEPDVFAEAALREAAPALAAAVDAGWIDDERFLVFLDETAGYGTPVVAAAVEAVLPAAASMSADLLADVLGASLMTLDRQFAAAHAPVGPPELAVPGADALVADAAERAASVARLGASSARVSVLSSRRSLVDLPRDDGAPDAVHGPDCAADVRRRGPGSPWIDSDHDLRDHPEHRGRSMFASPGDGSVRGRARSPPARSPPARRCAPGDVNGTTPQ